MPVLIKMFVTALLACGIILAAMYFFQDRLLYFPSRVLEYTPAQAGLDFEEVYFNASDGMALHGWYVPAPGARATLLFCHGNGGNISHRLDSLIIFHRLGLNVFIFDYRGYGRSRGRPSEQGTERDALAAWHWLTEEKRTDPMRLIVFGRSLGGAIAAELASSQPSAGLILESSFTSYSDIGRTHYPFLPVRLLARYCYGTIEKVASLSIPVLVVHSPQDELVPFSHGQALFEACGEPKEFLEISGGHNDGFLVSGDAYVRGIDGFISGVFQ